MPSSTEPLNGNGNDITDVLDPATQFTKRLEALDERLDKSHTRALEEAAKAGGVMRKLKKTASQSKTRFCMRAEVETEDVIEVTEIEVTVKRSVEEAT